jgi:hypothetical protein
MILKISKIIETNDAHHQAVIGSFLIGFLKRDEKMEKYLKRNKTE